MNDSHQHKFFRIHFEQLLDRLFPELKSEFLELEKRLKDSPAKNILFNKLLRDLEDKFPQLFFKDAVYDELFKTKFSVDSLGDLSKYVESAQGELETVKSFVESLIDSKNKSHVKIRSRVKTAESILRKIEVKKRPYISDLIGFQIIILDSDRFPEITADIFTKLDGKLEMFFNLFNKTHEEQQKGVGINSVHHKALHFYFSHENKFPVELQLVPRFTSLWHQVNHDTLYKEINSVTYEEELAIRYYGYLCNNLDYFGMTNID